MNVIRDPTLALGEDSALTHKGLTHVWGDHVNRAMRRTHRGLVWVSLFVCVLVEENSQQSLTNGPYIHVWGGLGRVLTISLCLCFVR